MSKQATKQRPSRPTPTARSLLAAASLILTACVLPSCVFIGSDKHAKLVHARDHNCEKAAVAVVRPVPNVAVTEGCTIKDATYYHVISGVSWKNTVAPLLKRVRFEHACEEEITWTVLNATNVGIDACDARMVYVSTIDGWVLNSQARPVDDTSS